MYPNMLLHNPRCRKSREALALLQEKEASFEIVEHLKDPPDTQHISFILAGLDFHPLQLMRTQEKVFKELNLSQKDDRPVSEWIEILAVNPILIERPIFIYRDKVALGRPPQNVLSLL